MVYFLFLYSKSKLGAELAGKMLIVARVDPVKSAIGGAKQFNRVDFQF
jgi:hypothetical protein